MHTKFSYRAVIWLLSVSLLCSFWEAKASPHKELQTAKIQLNLKKASILDVLKSIEAQTQLSFVYNNELKTLQKQVDFSYQSESVDSVLEKLATEYGVSFRRIGNSISVKVNTLKSSTDRRPIKGTVVDDKGVPIPGASVVVKGTTIGVATDFDGNFSLEVPSDAQTLIISSVGYHSQEIIIGKNTQFKVVLKEDTTELDEVVVVGYGVQKRGDVTTAIASVKAKDLEDKAVTSVAEAMVGKMPGVHIAQNTGAPGANLQVRVRGVGTITAGSAPLYVVDGVPLAKEDLNTFNNNDIESIQVLKDASSAAIYGSRGSNGVVLITTKKGAEGKPSFSYNTYLSIQNVSKKIDLLNAYEYADLVKDARNNSYADRMESINKRRAARSQAPISFSSADDNATRLKNTNNDYNTIIPVELQPYLQGVQGLTDTDWQDEIFRTAVMTNHSISISGGTPNLKYYSSLDYLNQDGIVIGSNFERIGLRLNLDGKAGIFKFGASLNPSFVKENTVNANGAYNSNGGGVIASALHYAPIFPVYNPDGTFSFAQNEWSASTVTMVNGTRRVGNSQTQAWNPVALARLNSNQTKANRLLGKVYAEAEFTKGLSYKMDFGFDIFSDAQGTFRPSTIPLSNTAGNQPSEAEATSQTSQRYNWVFEQTLNYNKDFGEHHLNALGGWTMQYQRDESNYMFANGFISNSIQTLNAGTVTRGNSQASEWALLSALARLQYSYKSKYMLSAALRADGASRFGNNNKWGYFPSLSAGWRITGEEFMKNITFLTDLKLRASYGLTGNFRIPNYGALGEFSYYSYVLGGSSPAVVKGMGPSAIPNPNLQWEKTAQLNVGFDASLWKGLLNLGLDLYNSNTYDLLLNVPIPRTTGFATRLENIGKVNNKGIEFNISSNINWGKWGFEPYFNYSKNINTVKALGPGNADIISTGSVPNAYFITRVGESIGSYYLPVVEGVFKNQAEVDASLHYVDTPNNYDLSTTRPGDFKFKDVNGDGRLDVLDTDRAIVGNYLPKFTYAFGTGITYENFDFKVDFQGVYGNQILNLSRRYFYNHEGNMNNYRGALNRWKSERDTGSGMNVRANRVSKGQNAVTSTWHVEDGSYLRIKNITLGYNLPKDISKYFSNVRLYCSIQNLYTFTNYEGYNPEVSNRTDATTSGEDYGVYPLARTFTLGLNLKF